MSCFVQICDEEGEEPMEIPLEDDCSLSLSTLTAQFPGACGLKYRHPETQSLRGVRLVEEKFLPPDEGWNYVFICNFPKENKRKIDDHMETSINKKRMEGQKCVDLIVLGLPWKTTEEELRQYFEQYGELLMAQVKKDNKTGQSKGFGFIRYGSYEAQRRALLQRHVIEGRVCDVRIPNSKEGLFPVLNSKVFIGRCTEDLTVEDLRDYFTKFGEVTDVFIPRPFRAFAFVTFLDPEVANMLCGEDHIIKGNSVYVSNAAPKSDRGPMGGNSPGGGFAARGGGKRSQGGNYGPPNNWDNGGGSGGNWGGANGNWGGGSNGGNWNKMGNMNPLTVPMLAALSQASMGLLGSMQGGGGDGGQYQGNQGGGNWNNHHQGGGNWDGNGGNNRYNR